MAYSDFSLVDVKEKLLLSLNEKESLFSEVKAIDFSDHLKETLKYNVPLAISIDTEKARSELIITPILVEVVKHLNNQISLFSGIEFNVDREKGLNGVCDYVLSLSSEQLFLDAPIITVVEAKNNKLSSGFGQCISEMWAAKLFNDTKGNEISSVYGLVTTGSLWKFMKLSSSNVWIDVDEYHISNVAKIMGIFVLVMGSK